MALTLGVSACANPSPDAGPPAGAAAIGESAGFAIAGAESAEDGSIALHGFAAPGSIVHVGDQITVASDLGTWTLTLTLSDGGAIVTVVAEGPGGELETLTIDLTKVFDQPEEDPAANEKEDGEEDDGKSSEEPIAIEVVQKRSSSDSSHPSALFVGSAPPGTGILAKSEFGTADASANDHGRFELEVPIDGAPLGVAFPITVFVGEDFEFHGEFIWLYEEPKEEPPKEEPTDKPVPITIKQYKGESDSPEPWEKFYGTAPAGTKISIQSEFGSSSGYAGSGGEYKVKVWFAGLTETTKFPITVWVGSKKFSFQYHWFAPNHEATAHQQYGECEADPPYDVFYGTGAPGTKVRIVSEYGSAERYVGDNGHWEKKVWFDEAPRGVEFPVTVWVGEARFDFTFTATAKSVETWAAQKWEIVDGTDVFNKYYGNGQPGSLVVITSDFGSAELTIGDSGEWLKQVSFDPPANTWFPVTVTIGDEYSKTFEMKWVYQEPDPIEFTVHQQVRESHELWELFWGTAQPGTTIAAESEFGGGSGVANQNGEFEFDLGFEGVEAGTTFTIWVSNEGETQTFLFTYLGPEGGGDA